ncbi:hypothetical protein ACRAWF_17760 [Streptomyces sp. L7]
MSAEATNPASPGPVTNTAPRRKARPRIDLRRLGRAALLGPAARDRLPDAIGHVAEAHRAHHPDADLEPLRRAWVLAESSHRGQMRKSGEPYITPPRRDPDPCRTRRRDHDVDGLSAPRHRRGHRGDT